MKLDIQKIMESFLHTIFEISSKEYQLRVWIQGKGPQCSSFDEIEDYFFLEGVDVIEHYKDYSITNFQNQELIRLRDLLEEFCDTYILEPFEFIDLPEWNEVVNQAKLVLKAFNYKKS